MANQCLTGAAWAKKALMAKSSAIPGAAYAIKMSNATPTQAYNSRHLASQVNGAQSPADAKNAPWDWHSFIFGRSQGKKK